MDEQKAKVIARIANLMGASYTYPEAIKVFKRVIKYCVGILVLIDNDPMFADEIIISNLY